MTNDQDLKDELETANELSGFQEMEFVGEDYTTVMLEDSIILTANNKETMRVALRGFNLIMKKVIQVAEQNNRAMEAQDYEDAVREDAMAELAEE